MSTLFIKYLPLLSILLPLCSLSADPKPFPNDMLKIMSQPKYNHATWGLYVKDSESGNVLYDLNSEKMFLPASTTKLFSIAALLHTYGDDYRFKTPIYAVGTIENDRLNGNIVLVAQGDLTFGGRQEPGTDQIEFTKLDHIIANNVPGVILTKADPLNGINYLARQVKEKGIKEITGDILIDDRLFDITEKRGMLLSPIMINENLIDIVINPTEIDNIASIIWRPMVQGYNVKNAVKTVAKGQLTDIKITGDKLGQTILVEGTISTDQKDVVRTFSIIDPNHFARAALIQALKAQGIKVNPPTIPFQLPSAKVLHDLQPLAIWHSPPLTEYAKLILKVSHNLGADLVPLLLAVHNEKRGFDEGMKEFGNFVINVVKIPTDSFVFIDGAGGDENRLTPNAEVKLLEYMKKLPEKQFQNFIRALPTLGVDGSLQDFAKNTDAVGKVFAKTGTGIAFNTAANQYFLNTQTLAGYINAENGHTLEFMLSTNNAQMPTINDIYAIFEDLSQISAIIYDGEKAQKSP